MSRRSKLYRWMADNYDAFQATLAEAGRPNWQELAKVFAEDGLTDSEGKPPSPEGTRQTWWKVRKAVEAARKKAPQPGAQSTLPAEHPAAASPAPPRPLAPATRKDEPMTLRPAQRRPPNAERDDNDEPYDSSSLPKPII